MFNAAHVQFEAQTKLNTLRREARETRVTLDLARTERRVMFDALRTWWHARAVRPSARTTLPHA